MINTLQTLPHHDGAVAEAPTIGATRSIWAASALVWTAHSIGEGAASP